MEHIFCSYYTKSEHITNYMCKMLDFNETHKVLEPSAGDGVFIDKLLSQNPNIRIDALDLNQKAVEILKEKYVDKQNVKVSQTDTLIDEKLDEYVVKGGGYDRIIGNPPYGGWLDYDKRVELKMKYNGHYAKETYSLFLLRCVSLLKTKGKLTFIIPDTFLFLHRHTFLREFLLTNTKILEIITFPSKLFPNVQFGYSNLSIITLEKVDSKNNAFQNSINLITGLRTKEDIDAVCEGNYYRYNHMYLNQGNVYSNQDHAFLMNVDDRVADIINNSDLKLGDIADCVTGIYVGDNKRFMKVKSSEVKNSKGYEVISEDEIAHEYINSKGLMEGLKESKYIPIVKGSSAKRYQRDEYPWYVNWSHEAVKHYNTDKKARFQNSQFYFRTGIVLPMVKSRLIRATLISDMVFDQSVVGVFPKDDKYTYFLLGLLNSEVIRDIVTTINPSANNSANYIKKIPIIIPENDVFEEITNKVRRILDLTRAFKLKEAEAIHAELDSAFTDIYLT